MDNPENNRVAKAVVDRWCSFREALCGTKRKYPTREFLSFAGSDIKDIYAEAKSAGFDVKVLRQLIRIRKQEPADVEEQETLFDVYRRALGM